MEKKLLFAIKTNPQIIQNDIAKEIGTSRATVQRMVKKLTGQGKLKRIGGKRFGRWEVHE